MWYLDSVRTFVTGFATSDQQIIARLQPLSNGSVHQVFGYESPVIKVKAVVVGDTDRDAIRSKARDGTTHSLQYSGSQVIGNVLVHSATFDRRFSICQTLRPDLADDAPVYDLDLELFVDE